MSELFLKIVNMSIAAGWLVLAVLVLRLILKKAPRLVNVLLWGLVAVRLICPFSFESALSLIPSAETVSTTIMMDRTPSVQTGIPALNSAVDPIISGSLAPAPGASANPLQIWIPILSIVWVVGIGALLLYTTVSYLRLRRKVSEAVILRDNIYQSENVGSPFVLGIVKPKIYLPFKLDDQNLEHVVAHEQVHIRRRDHWWKPLGFLLLTIHWFNPLMWLAYVLLCRDIEFACDEKVIKKLSNEQRADYTQALVSCSVSRCGIAACPLAFGEVGVKERVKSVLNYKKPTFWIIVLAVIVCVVTAVCFLTNPKGFQYDEASNTIVSASHFDVRTAADLIAVEMSPTQLSELSSRLVGVKDTKSDDEYAGLTPGYQISALLEDGTYIRISGYSLSDNDMVDIEWNGERYVVNDNDFQEYLSRICSGEDTVAAAPSVTEWFDYLESPEEMPWDGRLEIDLPEFPEVTFRWYPGKMEAVTDDKITPLYTGMPIWNTYFCDITGDGQPELCSTLTFGSGLIDSRIIVYDYANGASYELSDRGFHDFMLRLNENDGQLYVDKKVYPNGELVSSGRLVFMDDCIRIADDAERTDQLDVTISEAILRYGVSSGTYSVAGEDGFFLPNITFDIQNERFVLDFDPLSSCFNTGTIKIEHGKVIATTDDNKYTYIFQVIDNDTLQFVEKGSSKIATRSGDVAVNDGTEFKFVDKR